MEGHDVTSKDAVRLTGIFVYPLKGAKGIKVTTSTIDTFGLSMDRRWMLVDDAGRNISQRTHPRMTLISTRLEEGRLTVGASGFPDHEVPSVAPQGTAVEVLVEHDLVTVPSLGVHASQWFSDFLGVSSRLVFMPRDGERTADPQYAPGAPVSFPNAFPIHVASEEALRTLNDRLEAPIRMDRFRPNLVISGGLPHAEDAWRRIRIGDSPTMEVVKPCVHSCGMLNVDQQTGERNVEALRTLGRYRLNHLGVCFGQNLVPLGVGKVVSGGSVEVLQDGPPRPQLP